MRFLSRLAGGLLIAALLLSACQVMARPTKSKPSASPTERPTVTPTPTMPADLTPIVVNGTPVIIPSAIEFTPSPPPAVEPTSTGPSNGPTVTPDPVVVDFRVTPEDGLEFGQTVTASWEVEAKTGTLSYVYVTGPGEISSGDTFTLDTMKGSRQVTLKPVDALPLYVEFTIEATNGATDPQTGAPVKTISRVQAPVRCPYPWFFDHPPKWCPSAPDTPREGLAQRFEHGLMIGIENGVTILFSAPKFWTTYKGAGPGPGDAAAEGIDPMFYGQWHDGLFDNAPLKTAVGKPLGAAERYTAHAQCEFSPLYSMVSECFVSLPDGRVIDLYRHGTYGRNGITWHEWTGPAQ